MLIEWEQSQQRMDRYVLLLLRPGQFCQVSKNTHPGGKGGSSPNFWGEQISFVSIWVSFHFSDRS